MTCVLARATYIAGLEGLPKRIQNSALEFGQLVEEEDAEVGEADLARAHAKAATDQSGHRGAMVRRSERTSAHHLAALELSSHRRDHRDFERLGRLKRRQDPGQAGREKRLPCARRSAHQQIVPARGRDLERALGDFLSLHLLEVRPTDRQLCFTRHRRREHRCPLEMREQREQVGRGDDFDVPGPGSFGPLSNRADQPLVVRRSMQRREQHARRRRDPPIELELADDDIVGKRLRIRSTDRGEQGKRDRQIEMRTLLGQIRRRKVHRDPLGRQRQTDGSECGVHTLTALGNRLVRPRRW